MGKARGFKGQSKDRGERGGKNRMPRLTSVTEEKELYKGH